MSRAGRGSGSARRCHESRAAAAPPTPLRARPTARASRAGRSIRARTAAASVAAAGSAGISSRGWAPGAKAIQSAAQATENAQSASHGSPSRPRRAARALGTTQREQNERRGYRGEQQHRARRGRANRRGRSRWCVGRCPPRAAHAPRRSRPSVRTGQPTPRRSPASARSRGRGDRPPRKASPPGREERRRVEEKPGEPLGEDSAATSACETTQRHPDPRRRPSSNAASAGQARERRAGPARPCARTAAGPQAQEYERWQRVRPGARPEAEPREHERGCGDGEHARQAHAQRADARGVAAGEQHDQPALQRRPADVGLAQEPRHGIVAAVDHLVGHEGGARLLGAHRLARDAAQVDEAEGSRATPTPSAGGVRARGGRGSRHGVFIQCVTQCRGAWGDGRSPPESVLSLVLSPLALLPLGRSQRPARLLAVISTAISSGRGFTKSRRIRPSSVSETVAGIDEFVSA